MRRAESRRREKRPASLRRMLVGIPTALLLSASATAGEPLRIVPDVASPGAVGSSVHWSVEDSSGAEHRFVVLELGRGLRSFVDFAPRDALDWTPTEEGDYLVGVTARTSGTASQRRAWATYRVEAPEADAAVLPTDHPLVAVYASRLPSDAGGPTHACRSAQGGCEMIVHYRRDGSSRVFSSPPQPVSPRGSSSAIVSGLRESAGYTLWHEVQDERGRIVEEGGPVAFEAGAAAVPAPFSAPVLGAPPPDDADPAPFLLVGPLRGLVPYAIDLEGHLVWYDPRPGRTLMTRPTGEGTLLELRDARVIREIDPLGNIVRETNLDRINEQLSERGLPEVDEIHHEARRLPGGRTVVLTQRTVLVEDVQGPGAVRVTGDEILVLDDLFQVAWFWDSFDHLDLSRMAVLDEKIDTDPDQERNDWTHSNAVDYDPQDGSLLLSIRHQDWVIKIDYADGRGDGRIVWRLGRDGDFALEGGDPWAWFTHQHDANWIDPETIAVYDNGNTRCALVTDCRSRGQVYEIDEATREARLVRDLPLDVYSWALGSAQRLPDGRLHFGSGIALSALGFGSLAHEFDADGNATFGLFQDRFAYRSYRLSDLFGASRNP